MDKKQIVCNYLKESNKDLYNMKFFSKTNYKLTDEEKIQCCDIVKDIFLVSKKDKYTIYTETTYYTYIAPSIIKDGSLIFDFKIVDDKIKKEIFDITKGIDECEEIEKILLDYCNNNIIIKEINDFEKKKREIVANNVIKLR